MQHIIMNGILEGVLFSFAQPLLHSSPVHYVHHTYKSAETAVSRSPQKWLSYQPILQHPIYTEC